MMKKVTLFYIVFFSLCTHILIAQSMERHVIGSTGTTLNNTDISMSFTIGEIATTIFTTDELILLQGFHQGVFSDIIDNEFLDLIVYPNPTVDSFKIKNLTASAIVNIYDLRGRLVLQKKNVTTNKKIDVTKLNSALYIVKIKVGNRGNISKLMID